MLSLLQTFPDGQLEHPTLMVQPLTGTLLGAQSELSSNGHVEINLYVTLDTVI